MNNERTLTSEEIKLECIRLAFKRSVTFEEALANSKSLIELINLGNPLFGFSTTYSDDSLYFRNRPVGESPLVPEPSVADNTEIPGNAVDFNSDFHLPGTNSPLTPQQIMDAQRLMDGATSVSLGQDFNSVPYCEREDWSDTPVNGHE